MDEEQARHRSHLYEAEPDEDLIAALEPDQLVQARRHHGAPEADHHRCLWALWVFVIGVTVLIALIFR